jgi:diaminohydroxyphosphoribosylaminopyrimidine deaminase/5-amino-6-(5-phosphoribosylamino)uracil reductase
MVGIGTALADDPKLTARPAGTRTATRIVIDSKARLPIDSHLARTAKEIPVLLAVGPAADAQSVGNLEALGVEVLRLQYDDPNLRLRGLLDELGRRQMTNVLVEGGEALLGSLFDARQIDELHVFVAPKIAGGAKALSPIGGHGIDIMNEALNVATIEWQQVGTDMYLHGRTKTKTETETKTESKSKTTPQTEGHG